MDKYKDERCPKCDRPRPVVNPAWLRMVRQDAGLSVRAMARRLKVTATYISALELGKTNVTKRMEKAYETLEG